MLKTNDEYTAQPRKPATREEFFIRNQQALYRTKEVLDRLQPVIDAENKYLEQAAADMGIEHCHIKSNT